MTHPILDLDAVRRAVHQVGASDERTLREQIELSEIPAPPFGEGPRARRMGELMEASGLDDVEHDDVGNVLAWRHAGHQDAPLVVSAHVDTVFPAGTDVSVSRDGDVLRGPGISDDARGLATLLGVARALGAAGLDTETPLLFAATVGEEGLGDLRGVKHLFGPDGQAGGAAGFISLDGAGLDRVVTTGLGSRRFRITVRGPGGHSWVDWGLPNPLHALTELGSRLTRLPLAREPKTTLTLARTGGGKSINAIPQEAWLEVDTRCPDNEGLAALEGELREQVRNVESECAQTGAESADHGLTFSIEVIGDRPGGSTPTDTALVQAAIAATRAVEREPVLVTSSTDANIPMSLGVPAVTLGCGGEAGQAHTTEEWYRNVNGPEGVTRALYAVLLAAGVAGDP